jgi:16S rRNA (guanine(1405)-N(7))-methyltransferase
MEIEELITAVKNSKKYKHLSEEVIKQKIDDYIQKNKDWQNYKDKFILKEIKAKLHKVYGSFQNKAKKKRDKYLAELAENPSDLDRIDKILFTNQSTKERLEIYEEYYEELFQITGKPKVVVDLGCGMNPVSLAYYLGKGENLDYYAYDINEQDINFLNEFFEIVNDQVNGKAELINLQNMAEVEKIPSCDICFMLKLVDVLEEKGHKHSEELIKELIKKCKFIVVSFATRSISGKKMKYGDRGWIERMLERIELKFEKMTYDNEIFYVISKEEPKSFRNI